MVIINGKDKYIKRKFLGSGSFGKCYLTLNKTHKKLYCMKIFNTDISIIDIENEINMHKELNHEHIVMLYSFFIFRKKQYLILELCHYNSMQELLKRRKFLVESEIKYFIAQLLNALEYLQSKNIVHCDLKLSNLLIDQNMKLKICDFGLALILPDHVTEIESKLRGSPKYQAPEIFDNIMYGFQSDIWAVGIMLYTLSNSIDPFHASTVKGIYTNILNGTFVYKNHISHNLRHLIDSILIPKSYRLQLNDIIRHDFFTNVPSTLDKKMLHENISNIRYKTETITCDCHIVLNNIIETISENEVHLNYLNYTI